MAESSDEEQPGADTGELERLRRENLLLVAMLASASELVVVLAPDGTLVRTFRARGRPLGYEPSEMAGHNMLELIYPEDAEVAADALAQLAQGHGASVQVLLRLKRRDGSWVPMECSAENRSLDPVLRGIVVCLRDVSARLELERKLRLAQRLESVGRVASGIVHDFNNLLAVMLLNVDRVSSTAAGQLPAAGRDALREILRAAERGASLTKRLLSLVRDRPVQPRALDLAELIAAQQSTLRSLLPDDVLLELASSSVPLPVVADPAELEHVLLNLVLNARDALPRGGRVQVETRLAESADPGVAPRRAIVEVRDDGLGMDTATRRRVFEPFFTTKSAERGTGLGLWTVQDVVCRHGGSIELLSSPQQGSTFRVLLPLASAGAEPAPLRASSGAALCVLLVDDEPRLLELLRSALADAGHAVHVASDGVAALALLDRSGLRPNVLVTDVSMPGLGGRQLAARLRARWPELPVLLISGLGEAANGQQESRTALLSKPFSVEELLAALAVLVPRASDPG